MVFLSGSQSVQVFVFFHICIAVRDPVIKNRRDWDHINRFNSSTRVCPFQVRIWIPISISHGLFVQGDPKKTKPTKFWIKLLFSFVFLDFSGYTSRLYAWKIGIIVFPKMSWSTKEKIFCLEVYFANKSYTVVQACLLGYSSTGGCLAEVVTLNKVHSTGSHFETWHHRTILVWGWKWASSNGEHGALCGSTDEVLGIIGMTQRYRSRWTMVPARWGHPLHIKWLPSLA